MSKIKYYIIDTETTGLNSSFHEVSEIGIIRCDDRVQLWKQVKCFHPERASLDALAITKKTMNDLRMGESKYEVVNQADRFFNEDGLKPSSRCIVGHNIVSFDRKFLHSLWESVGKKFPANLWLDTIHLTNDFIKNSNIPEEKMVKTATGKISKTLSAACDMVGVKKFSGVHNAKSDSRNNYILWKSLVEEHKINYISHIKTIPHVFSDDSSQENDI
jgi:DNA polymerase III epsilon subunit-like protein